MCFFLQILNNIFMSVPYTLATCSLLVDNLHLNMDIHAASSSSLSVLPEIRPVVFSNDLSSNDGVRTTKVQTLALTNS